MAQGERIHDVSRADLAKQQRTQRTDAKVKESKTGNVGATRHKRKAVEAVQNLFCLLLFTFLCFQLRKKRKEKEILFERVPKSVKVSTCLILTECEVSSRGNPTKRKESHAKLESRKLSLVKGERLTRSENQADCFYRCRRPAY